MSRENGMVCFTGIDPNDRNVQVYFEKFGVRPVCAFPRGAYPCECSI